MGRRLSVAVLVVAVSVVGGFLLPDRRRGAELAGAGPDRPVPPALRGHALERGPERVPYRRGRSIRPVLDAVQPALPGLTVQIAARVTAQLVVANPTPTTLSVLDGDGQPLLRIGPEGVLANRSSPWWYLTNSPNGDAPIPADAQPGAPPRWERVSADPAWGWFEHRLHPAPQGVPPDVSRTHRLTALAR